jgi:archaellum component FlaC
LLLFFEGIKTTIFEIKEAVEEFEKNTRDVFTKVLT